MISGRRAGVLALAVAFSLVWSSAFIAGKIAVADMDAATALTLRFAVSAALLAPFATWRDAKLGVALGLLINAAYLGLSFSALGFCRPVVVIAIVSCAPFATAALAAMLRIEPVAPRQIVGAGIGVAGAWIVLGFDGAGAELAGVCLAAAGMVAFSLATLLFRARGPGTAIGGLNFWQSITGAIALAPFAYAHGRGFGEVTIRDALAILYLAIPVTMGGIAMWFALIRLSGAASASTAHLMNPLFGALLSAFALRTPLVARDFAGAAVIALGLALASRPVTAPPGSSR